MLQWSFFAIALVAVLALTFLLWKSLTQNSSNLTMVSEVVNRQTAMNQTLTNLLLSRDPMTFQQIQATTNLPPAVSQFEEHVSPMDDASIAMRMAKHYEAQGLDPNLAYAQDDIDFRSEFGL